MCRGLGFRVLGFRSLGSQQGDGGFPKMRGTYYNGESNGKEYRV